MASSTAGSGATADLPCPDPAAHQHSNKLSEQASTAALYVTQPDRGLDVRESEKINPLGPDGKLSARGAATSLKYAKAQDLPSFPSRGIAADSASKAALLAKDYKMKDLWQPELSNAASKASLLAARDGGKVDLWQATPTAAGNSAATLAMRNNGLSPEIDRGYTADGRSRALAAATLSHNQSQQKRANPTPPAPTPAAYPDSQNSTANALNAATVSHRNSTKMAPDGWDSEANQAARVKNLAGHVDPKMFGDRPPVEIEQEEKRRQAALRASAVSMAKQMYDLQANRPSSSTDLSGGREGAETAHARQAPSTSGDVKEEAMRYIHLQDAAHKLAQERLAKVDKNLENARYREYYGYPDDANRKSLNRLSMRGRNRNRAGSGATADDDDSDDEERARRIRGQMSQLTSGLSSVDEKKRSDDRAKLLAAAEKRVHAQMHDMDERVFLDTGKVPPAMMEEWENKARQRAQEEKELRAANPGKTHIGGGKFIDQAELEAIAQARLKPTLDEINDTAEKKRARDEELRLEKEEQDRTKREEKRQHREEKDEQKRAKNEEKAAARKEKEEEKSRKEEEKRLAKEEKRKSRDQKRESAFLVGSSTAAGATAGEAVEGDAARDEPSEAKSQRKSGLFGRLSTKLKRRSQKPEDETQTAEAGTGDLESGTRDHTKTAEGALVGGAAGVALAEHDHQKHEPENEDDKLDSTGTRDQVLTEPEQADAAADLASGHTGDHTDALPSSEVEQRRPSLERHITTVETSDEEDEGLKAREENLSRPAEVVAATAVAAPLVASETTADREATPVATVTSHEETSVAAPTIGDAATAVPDEPHPVLATVAKEPLSADYSRDPVSPIETEPLSSERITAQPIDEFGESTHPVADDARPTEAVSSTADISPVNEESAVTHPDEQALASVGSVPGQHETVSGLGKPIAGRGGGIGIAAYDGPSTRGDTGPAPNTIGPHKSDLANILDPRVKPEPEKMKERGTAGPHRSDMLNMLDPRVESDPFKAQQKEVEAASGPAKLQKSQGAGDGAEADAAPEKKKGLRGLLGKLKHRSSRSENKLSKQAPEATTSTEDRTEKLPTQPPLADAANEDATRAGETGVATTTPDTGDKDLAVNTASAASVPEIVETTSPSSFRRHADDLNDLDDVSSSGAEEEDIGRGRKGSSRRLNGKGGKDSEQAQKTSTSNDEDQFEEARDHFDESLAPPPAFAGQAKSESPVRGTKFQEVGL